MHNIKPKGRNDFHGYLETSQITDKEWLISKNDNNISSETEEKENTADQIKQLQVFIYQRDFA